MSQSREQSLVNAEVEIHRAMFLMNAAMSENNRIIGKYVMKPEEYSDQKVLAHIDKAIKDLREAREGYFIGQLTMFNEEN